MQGAGFSQTQVWAMCTQLPALLGINWTSVKSIEKAQFVTLLLGLSLDNIAARPHLLAYPVGGLLDPRVWFMYQTGAIEAPNSMATSGLLSYISLPAQRLAFSKDPVHQPATLAWCLTQLSLTIGNNAGSF